MGWGDWDLGGKGFKETFTYNVFIFSILISSYIICISKNKQISKPIVAAGDTIKHSVSAFHTENSRK